MVCARPRTVRTRGRRSHVSSRARWATSSFVWGASFLAAASLCEGNRLSREHTSLPRARTSARPEPPPCCLSSLASAIGSYGLSLLLRHTPIQLPPAFSPLPLRRLSALLGSMGFFYGWTTVAPAPNAPAGLVPSRTPLNGLLAVVPSRPFFPRGFLWDEGFHQLVVGGALPEVERESRSSILPSFDGESRSSIARCSRPVAGGRRRSHRIITLCSHHVTAPSFAQHGTRLCPIISSHRG